MRNHKLFYGSSYDRGLLVLLKMWPDILSKFPDAELHIAYGWDLFDRVTTNNAERQEWKKRMVEMMTQKGITEHGRLGKVELKKIRSECGILAYTADFQEIFCITAVEAQLDGLVPITPDLAALKETNIGGIIIEGDIYDPEVKRRYLAELLCLMGDENKWQEMSKNCQMAARQFAWEKIALKWRNVFEEVDESVKVSIITPTIRRGFWNIMANNLASQTYKNFEWIIVDDYPADRSDIAKKYASKYGIEIKYLRGKEHKVKRNYALVNANNTGFENASGELLMILQDFILMPSDGVEQAVRAFKVHPDYLYAPCDIYHAPAIKPDTNSEDWFNGELNVIGEFMRKNIRIKGEGARESTHPYDFEQNYCAIPRKIAEELGGWYEFFDFGLGFDNTEFAYRAILAGHKILVDDTNICVCIDHWNTLEGTAEHGLGREHNLNDPLFLWEKQKLEDGKLPLKRSQETDDRINLTYKMPEELDPSQAVDWMRSHLPEIISAWPTEI